MYDWVLRGLQLGGLGVLPMLWVYDAPFGKFGVPTSWNVHGAWPSDAGNLGWMVMEAVAPITAVVAALRAPAPSVASHVMLAVFVAHYVNRALVQPYLSPPRTPLHVSVVLSAILFNACNGYLQGSWLYAGGPPRALQGLGWGLAVCAAGAAGNIYHDGVLRRLRTTAPAPGEKVVQQGSSVYRIPHGGLFTWLSSPNYVCECTFFLVTQGSSGEAGPPRVCGACHMRARRGTTILRCSFSHSRSS